MAVNLSFTANEEDFTARGFLEQYVTADNAMPKALPDEFNSPYQSTPSQCFSPRRYSDDTTAHQSSVIQTPAKRISGPRVVKNASFPAIARPRKSPGRSASALARPSHVLRSKEYCNSAVIPTRLLFDSNCSSDSEVIDSQAQAFSNSNFYRNASADSENRAPQSCQRAKKHFESVKNADLICKSESSGASAVNRKAILSEKGTSENIKSSRIHHSSSTSNNPDRLSSSSTTSEPSLQSFSVTRFRRKSDTSSSVWIRRSEDLSPVRDSVDEVKRSKSFLTKSPNFRKRSPTFVRRKSPYKEFESLKNHLDLDESIKEKVTFHQSPKSSTRSNQVFVESSDPVNSTTTKQKRLKESQPKSNRKHRHSVSWIPVQEMMTNHQYEGHYHDESSGEEGRYTEQDGSKIPRMKSFDAVVFDVLKVSPEDFARQLTLLDLPIFRAIMPDEITSCGWTKKEKWEVSPNVCAMSQRFNNTSFWVIHEVLHASTDKIRAEILTHFIKIAKKLYELSNLHSLMAVIQSLNSSSIFRLTRTWAMIHKNHKATFDRLLSLVKEDGNRRELRSHIEGIKLPCIPFLGMYLSDVMYINSAHPDTGGLESHERTNKMNNILRVIAEFQQSKYDNLQEEPHIKKYLNSVKYIEELQKFLEEDNYKLSLKIEPTNNAASISDKKLGRVKEDGVSGKSAIRNDTLLRPYSQTPPVQQKFIPGHRKSRSLGREFAFSGSSPARTKPDNTKVHKRRRSLCSRSKQRDSTVWYISPVKGHRSMEYLSSSGSLPRRTDPSSNPAVTTSLLDDSIITATPSSLASSSSSNTRMSVAGGNSGSIGSSRSNSGSEFSEQDEMSWSSDSFKRWSLPQKKTLAPAKWFKVYHGNRGKYSLRAAKVKLDKKKSSTYPTDRTSDLQSVYKLYVSSQKLTQETADASGSAESSSTVSDIDEFAKMRSKAEGQDALKPPKPCATTTTGDVVNVTGDVTPLDYYVDDEEVNLISLDKVSLKGKNKRLKQKMKEMRKRTKCNVRDTRSAMAISERPGQTLRVTDRTLRQYFVSPRISGSEAGVSQRHRPTTTTIRFADILRAQLRKGVTSLSLTETTYGGYEADDSGETQTSSNSSDSTFRTMDISNENFQTCEFEGSIKRKCVLKQGKKPTVSPWTKYWISICDTKLVYYAAKTIRGHERHHFKSRPCKVVSIQDWMLLHSSDFSRMDCFQLSDPNNGNTYRFQCETKELASKWLFHLKQATAGYPQPERDLIILDDT